MYKPQFNKVKIPGKTNVSKVYLIIHILDSLPNEYKVAVSSLKGCLIDTMIQVPLRTETVWEKVILCHNFMKQHKKDMLNNQAYADFKNQYKT